MICNLNRPRKGESKTFRGRFEEEVVSFFLFKNSPVVYFVRNKRPSLNRNDSIDRDFLL